MLTDEQLRLIRMYYHVHENKIYRGEFAPKETPKEEYCVGTVNHQELFVAQDLTSLRSNSKILQITSRILVKIENVTDFRKFLRKHSINYETDISDEAARQQWREISASIEDLI